MKLNSITTPNGNNNTDLKTTLDQLSQESWALYCLAGLGTKATLHEIVEANDLFHLFETIEKRIEAMHYAIEALTHCDALKPATPSPAGTEAQTLLNLLLTMLKHWRAAEISGNEFEDWLEQCVSIASTLAEVKS